MRKALVLATAMLFVASTAMAQTIVGSDHDFSGDGWSGGEICVVCHTPHHADITVSASPLWNHDVTGATFQLYTSNTLDAVVGQPDGSSKLCLSCHDGTVAIDSYGGGTGSNFVNGADLVGTDLRDDHPVSFTYDATLASNDGGLNDPSTANSGLGGTIAADLLAAGKMQCSSCHGVHNEYGVSKLLVKSNASSALCLTCHAK